MFTHSSRRFSIRACPSALVALLLGVLLIPVPSLLARAPVADAEPAVEGAEPANTAPATGQPTGATEPDLAPEKAPPVFKEGPTDGRVLPKATDKLLEKAFGAMAPTWTLKDATIVKTKVTATVCDAAGACVELELSDPKRGCAGDTVGAWCVVWKTQPEAEAKKVAHDALAKDADGTVWQRATHKAHGGHKAGDGDPDNPPPADATRTSSMATEGTDMPPAEMDDPSLLLLLAAAFGVLIAAIALFRMKGDDDEAAGDGDDSEASASGDSDAESGS